MVLQDEKLLLKVRNYKFGDAPDFVDEEVQYHHQCKRIYLHQKEENTSKNQSYRIKYNLFILEFVESKVIAGQKPILASLLLEHYKNYYADLGADIDNLQSYTIQNLSLYIKKNSSSVDLEIKANQSKTVLYNKATMKYDEAF